MYGITRPYFLLKDTVLGGVCTPYSSLSMGILSFLWVLRYQPKLFWIPAADSMVDSCCWAYYGRYIRFIYRTIMVG